MPVFLLQPFPCLLFWGNFYLFLWAKVDCALFKVPVPIYAESKMTYISTQCLFATSPLVSLIVPATICDFHEDRELACPVSRCDPGVFLEEVITENRKETRDEQDMTPAHKGLIRIPMLSTQSRNYKETTALGPLL